MRTIHRIAAVGLLALPSLSAQAQPALSPVAPQDPLYQIELIVFLHASGSQAEEDLNHGSGRDGSAARRLRLPQVELETLFGVDPSAGGRNGGAAAIDAAEPLPGPGAPAGGASPGAAAAPPGDALELIETRAAQLQGSTIQSGTLESELPEAFAPLSRDALELGSVYTRLDRSSAYRVLAHTGWIQAGVDAARAKWLDLKHLGVTNPTGSVRIRLGRFLFVALDLDVFDGGHSLWTAAPGGPGPAPLVRAPSYEIALERSAIRLGELHYFDHPFVGVLVRITPAPRPEDGTAAGEEPAA